MKILLRLLPYLVERLPCIRFQLLTLGLRFAGFLREESIAFVKLSAGFFNLL